MARAEREGVLAYLTSTNSHFSDCLEERKRSSLDWLLKETLLKSLLECFSTWNRPWAILKGPALSFSLYDNPLHRPFGDIDLLVLPEDRGAARRRLVENLGLRQDPGHPELFFSSRGQVDLHIGFLNTTRVPARAAATKDANLSWSEHITFIDTPHGRLPTLDPHLTLTYLLVHYIHHHGAAGARWLLDLHRFFLIENTLSQSRRPGSRFESVVFHQLRFFLKNKFVPKTLLSPRAGFLEKAAINAAWEGRPIPALRFLFTLLDIPRVRPRIRFLHQTLLPNSSTAAAVMRKQRTSSARFAHAQMLFRSLRTLLTLGLRSLPP